MSKPRGQVYMTDQTAEVRDGPAWRGIIHGSVELWRGRAHESRSLAHAEMEKANKELDLGAELAEPLPDDHPV